MTEKEIDFAIMELAKESDNFRDKPFPEKFTLVEFMELLGLQ